MSSVQLALVIVVLSGAVLAAALFARPDTPVLGAIAAPAREALGGLAPGGAAEDATPRATLYQYTDAKGVVRFVKRLEDVPPALRARAGVVEMDPAVASGGSAPPAARAASRAGRPKRGAKAAAEESEELPAWRRYDSVVLYTTSWCGYCKSAIEDLEERRVDYTVKQIDTDIHAKSELKNRTGSTSVPQLVADDRHVVGYSAATYEALFGSRK
jgi:glutaredoxin